MEMDKKLMSLNGVFAVFKPAGESSAKTIDRVKSTLLRSALNKIDSENGVKSAPNHLFKRLSRQIKVGHGGTLDPMATGVLVVGLNAGCKDLSKYLAGPKTYLAQGRFGEHYDTLDCTGRLLQRDENWQNKAEKITDEMVREKFVGDAVMQVPPAFSAIHVNGKRAYDLARKESESIVASETLNSDNNNNIIVSSTTDRSNSSVNCLNDDSCNIEPLKEASFSIPARPVAINSLIYTATLPTFNLSVECGGGCYIRSLIRDLAAEVGTLAVMTELSRVKQGVFTLEMCLKGEEEWSDLGIVEEAIKKAKDLVK